MVLILGAIAYSFDGHVGRIWLLASQGGHTRMLDPNLFTFSLKTEVTLLALIVGGGVTNVAMYGSDQVIVQRYLATASKREMAKAVMFNGIVTLPVMGMLWMAGIGLSAYYAVHPALAATLTTPDQVLPHFIVNALHPIVGGLIIAGIFAATMSTLSCGLNSLTTASMVDFYLRWRGVVAPEAAAAQSLGARDLTIARWSTLAWALVATIGAMFVDHLGSFGAFSGMILGTALTAVVAAMPVPWLPEALQPASVFPISWLWYGPVGCVCTLIVGYALSLARPAPRAADIAALTFGGTAREVVREV
jgi:Na+/proline symporter